MCMQRQDRRELLPFDPELEQTLHRLSREHAQPKLKSCRIKRMKDNSKEGMNHRWSKMDRIIEIKSPRSFVQPDNPHMLLEEFALPPTIVQSAIRRPPIQAYNLKLKGVTLQMLHNIQFHGLLSENPNVHLTSFIEVCDTIKYNGVTEEALRLRLFPLSFSDRAKHWLTSQPSDSITSWNDLMQKFLTKIFPPAKIS